MFDTWQGILFTHMAVGIAGFLVGAMLFLGHGEARSTEDFRSGLVADRRAARGRRCTTINSRWCPLHGECSCVVGPGENERLELDMDDHSCALHGDRSLHGAN